MSYSRETHLKKIVTKSKVNAIILWLIALGNISFFTTYQIGWSRYSWNLFQGTNELNAIFLGIGILFVIFSIYATKQYAKHKNEYNEYRVQQTERIAEKGMDPKAKLQVFGMIKAHNKLEIPKAAKILGVNAEHIRARIYELIGEGKVDGTFPDDDVFQITSSIADFIRNLDDQFEEWGKSTKKI